MNKPRVTPFPVRLDPDLRQTLEDAAKDNDRSLQAEVVARLMTSVGNMPNDEKRIRQIAREVALEVVQIELTRSAQRQ